MTLHGQIRAWMVLLVLFILFLWIFRGILLPFIAGMILAYLLDPVADFLEKIKFSRFWATLTIMVTAIAVIVGLILFIAPPMLQQLLGLLERFPVYIAQLHTFASDYAGEHTPDILARLGTGRSADIESWLNQAAGSAGAFLLEFLTRVAQSSLTVINALGLLVVTPVVAFYLLLDWDHMVERLDNLLPRAHRDEIRHVLSEINVAMAGFLRGQSLVVAILAVFYATALTLAGLNFGLAIGLTAGLFSFIPYVGFVVGFCLSVGVAIVQFWPDWIMVSVVVGIFAVGQFVEGNILYPRLVGRSIGVHAVWLMFALFAFAFLFGAVGVLLAVPMAAITGVLVRYATGKYLASPLYDHDPGTAMVGETIASNEVQGTR